MESHLCLHTTCEKRPNVHITQCSLSRVMRGKYVCVHVLTCLPSGKTIGLLTQFTNNKPLCIQSKCACSNLSVLAV